jgi:hypothetical protein
LPESEKSSKFLLLEGLQLKSSESLFMKVKLPVNLNPPPISLYPAYSPLVTPVEAVGMQAATLPTNMSSTFIAAPAAQTAKQPVEKPQAAPNVFGSFIEQEKKLWHPVNVVKAALLGAGAMLFTTVIVPLILFPDMFLYAIAAGDGPPKGSIVNLFRKIPAPLSAGLTFLFLNYTRLITPLTRPLRRVFNVPPF